MRGKENSHILVLSQITDHTPERISRLRVQSRRRLIQNQDLRPVEQRSRNVDPPSLATGQFAHRSLQNIFKIQKTRQLFKSHLERLPGDPVECRPALQIFPHTECLIQNRILEHHAKLPLNCIHILVQITSVDHNFPTVFRKLTTHNVDRRRFPRPVNAEESKQLSLLHTKAQIPNRFHLTKTFIQMLDLNNIFHILSPLRSQISFILFLYCKRNGYFAIELNYTEMCQFFRLFIVHMVRRLEFHHLYCTLMNFRLFVIIDANQQNVSTVLYQ